MDELYNITNQLYQSLFEEKDKLTYIERHSILQKSNILQSKTDIEFYNFLHNNMEYVSWITKFKWGSILNLDLLADYLNQVIYVNRPHGAYEEIKREKDIVTTYYDKRNMAIYNYISKIIFINSLMNYFIKFVRENYNPLFFDIRGVENKHELIYAVYKIPSLCRHLLDVGNYSYSNKLKTATEVLKIIHALEEEKEDLLSEMIDSSKFQESCLEIYGIYLEDLKKLLDLLSHDESQIFNNQKKIIMNFAYLLQEFIKERINCLSVPDLKKLNK